MKRKSRYRHDVDLSSFIDRELDPIQYALMVRLINNNPDLFASFVLYRRQMQSLRNLYDPILSEPVPERLLDIIRGSEKSE